MSDRRDPRKHTPVERIVEKDKDVRTGYGAPLSSRARQSQRSVESYLQAGVRPRWMERIGDIDGGIATHRRRLARTHRVLREECGRDFALFAERWESLARGWRFDELNDLIAQHNEWYPIERNLPLNPRTGEYVPVAGRSYRRPLLGAAWILEQFPARPPRAGAA